MKNLLCFCALLFAGTSFSQNYILDTSFNHTGHLITPKKSSATFGNSILYQPDGKLVVSGAMLIPNSVLTINAFISYRLGTNGQLDASYADTGRAITKFYPLTSDAVNASLIQPDNKIILAGEANGNMGLVRYRPDGRPDSTFGVNGLVEADAGSSTDAITCMTMLSNGYILASGGNFIAKFKPNGQPDSTFGTAGLVQTQLNTVSLYMNSSFVVLPNGKIVMAGYHWDNTTGYDPGLVRYNPNGSVDTTFGVNGMALVDFGSIYDYGVTLHYKSNGNLLLTGNTPVGDTYYKFAAAEFLPNGSLNTAFGNAGKAVAATNQKNNFLSKSVMLPNGDVMLCGFEYDLNAGPMTGIMMRLLAGGQFDSSLNGTGFITLGAPAYISQLRDMLVQPDGKLVVCGISDVAGDTRFQIARYKPVQSTAGITTHEKSSLLVYPNPATGLIHIQGGNGAFSIRISDMAGRTVLNTQSSGTADVSGLSPGAYIIECEDASGAVRRAKFVKE